MALQVNPLQAEAALPPGAIFSRSFPGILGSSDSVQIHHHLDKDLNLPPLPAHLHDQDFSANGAHHHGLCHHVRFREHHSNDCTVHATRAHLGSCCPRELHQSHGFLVCECFSEHHRRLPDTCPAYARCQKLAATSTTAVGSHNGLRLGWLVRLSSSRLTSILDPKLKIKYTAHSTRLFGQPSRPTLQSYVPVYPCSRAPSPPSSRVSSLAVLLMSIPMARMRPNVEVCICRGNIPPYQHHVFRRKTFFWSKNSSSHSPSPENLFCLHLLRNTLTPNLSRSPFPRPKLSSRCV